LTPPLEGAYIDVKVHITQWKMKIYMRLM